MNAWTFTTHALPVERIWAAIVVEQTPNTQTNKTNTKLILISTFLKEKQQRKMQESFAKRIY
jgi:hypothetical protein